jgi:hypothetical protein
MSCTLAGGHVVRDLRAVAAVVHHQQLQVSGVVHHSLELEPARQRPPCQCLIWLEIHTALLNEQT